MGLSEKMCRKNERKYAEGYKQLNINYKII